MPLHKVLNSVSSALMAACLALLAAPAVLGQTSLSEASEKALAAGYQAAFICSATWNGGKGRADIHRHELSGVYEGWEKHFQEGDKIGLDREKRHVSVRFNKDMPPRIAVWRPGVGCSQLPVGAEPEAAAYLPALDYTRPQVTEPWLSNGRENLSKSAATALEAAVDKAFRRSGQGYGAGARTSAILVIKGDEIVAERYAKGFSRRTSQRTWSVAKSIAASIIGVAVEDGILDINAPVGLSAWASAGDPRQAITTENLLHMASGLDSGRAGNRTDRLYFGGGTVEQTAMQSALETPPGTRWKYANNDTLLAIRALREKLGRDAYLAYPAQRLFDRIGMVDTVAELDWQGNFVLSSQVWTTAHDLARLGRLYLQDGIWEGERILPAGWRDYVMTPAPAQPPMQNANGADIPGYGAQWWLYGMDGRFMDLPPSMAARGNRGQFLFLVPSLDLIIIRRGYDIAGQQGFQIHDFARDVIDVIEALQ